MVMSFNPLKPLEYSIGFNQPNGRSPLEILTSLRSAISPATTGVDAEVPPTRAARPDRKIRKRSDCAAISGIPYKGKYLVVKSTFQERMDYIPFPD